MQSVYSSKGYFWIFTCWSLISQPLGSCSHKGSFRLNQGEATVLHYSVTKEFIGKAPWLVPPKEVVNEKDLFTWITELKPPILLYWGAEWCPPCNDLKAQVLTHPDFESLTSISERIYIDGDSDHAQIFAERLGVSGYPAILVLGSNGEEKGRITDSLNFEEFKDAFIAAAMNSRDDLHATLSEALEGRAERNDWTVLAYTRWEPSVVKAMTPRNFRHVLMEVAKLVPKELPREKALIFAAASMENIKQLKEKISVDRKTTEEFVEFFVSGLERLFSDETALAAARGFISYEYEQSMVFLEKFAPDKVSGIRNRWLEASEKIGNLSGVSSDAKMWSVYPLVQDYKRNYTKLSQADKKKLESKVKEHVSRNLITLKTQFERKATVSGASYLLQQVGDFDGAEKLLQAEIPRTDTPWYLYSALSSLERRRERNSKALEYSRKATSSVKGRASKLQWMTDELVLGLKLGHDQKYLSESLSAFYTELFNYDDGFFGRNQLRLKRIEKGFRKSRVSKDLLSSLEKFAEACPELSGETRERCRSHFKALSNL